MRPQPYPADTKAKGWRLELDMEQFRQSDTWALASPVARPWLLMLWAVSWEQVPCGSLPNDDELIAARLGLELDQFAQMKRVLLRNWWLAEDGRLYHDVMASRVNVMLEKKAKDRDRKSGWRTRQSAGVTPTSRGTDAGRTPESTVSDDTKHQAPSTSNTSSLRSDVEPARASRQPPPECPPDVNAQVWADWLTLRKDKKAKVTYTVIQGAREEAKKAGMSFEDFLRVWCRRGSQGLEADWLKPHERGSPKPQPLSKYAGASAAIWEDEVTDV